jgi:hypothetical protein
LAPERRGAARPVVRHWVHQAAVSYRQPAAGSPQPEVRLEAASYLQPAACRGRRVVDRYAATERLPEVHPQAGSSRQPAASREPRVADRCAAAERRSALHRPGVSSWLRRRAVVQRAQVWPAGSASE